MIDENERQSRLLNSTGATPEQLHNSGLGYGGGNTHLSASNQQSLLQAHMQADLYKQLAKSVGPVYPTGPAGPYSHHGLAAPSKPFNWRPLGKLLKFLAWMALLALLLVVLWSIKPLWTNAAGLGMTIAGVNDWTRTDEIDKFLQASIKKEAMDNQALAKADAHMDKWIKKDFDTREGRHARQLLVAGALYNPQFHELGITHLDRALMDTAALMAEKDKTKYEDYPALYVELLKHDAHLLKLRSRTQGLASSIPESAKLQKMAAQTRRWQYPIGAFLHSLSLYSTHPPTE